MTEHTPGPWKYDDAARRRVASWPVKSASCKSIAAVWCRFNGLKPTAASIAEGRANARLIAAAPAMLEVLQAIIGCLGSDGYLPSCGATITEQARTAIAAATGETGEPASQAERKRER